MVSASRSILRSLRHRAVRVARMCLSDAVWRGFGDVMMGVEGRGRSRSSYIVVDLGERGVLRWV